MGCQLSSNPRSSVSNEYKPRLGSSIIHKKSINHFDLNKISQEVPTSRNNINLSLLDRREIQITSHRYILRKSNSEKEDQKPSKPKFRSIDMDARPSITNEPSKQRRVCYTPENRFLKVTEKQSMNNFSRVLEIIDSERRVKVKKIKNGSLPKVKINGMRLKKQQKKATNSYHLNRKSLPQIFKPKSIREISEFQ